MDNIKARLSRVEKQINHYILHITELSKSENIKTICRLKEDKLGYELIIDSLFDQYQIEELSVEFGEIVHNLRSCLDNLAFDLACSKTNPPERPENIYFPIYEDRHRFVSRKKELLKQFNPEVVEKFESIQPFQRDGREGNGLPQDDPLLLIQFLNNMDKHRDPNVLFLSPKEINWKGSVEFNNEEDAKNDGVPNTVIYAGYLYCGVKLMEYTTKYPIKSASGKFTYQIGIEIEFRERHFNIIETLSKLIWYVRLVINHLDIK